MQNFSSALKCFIKQSKYSTQTFVSILEVINDLITDYFKSQSNYERENG